MLDQRLSLFRFTGISEPLDFKLPPELEASEPPEGRGLARDQVRLMVSSYTTGQIVNTRFHQLPDFLQEGDLLVLNTSSTLKAALPAGGPGKEQYELHLSTRLPGGLWVVELRRPGPTGSQPFLEGCSGDVLSLPGGGRAWLLTPYRKDQRRLRSAGLQGVRLWIAELDLPEQVETFLERYGSPIRYRYVRDEWPVSYYQTVYARELGSAEMPSAGRAFTWRLLDELQARGVRIAGLVLHTGVASLEDHEPPYEEYYRVPAATAELVNETRRSGGRVVAVGTTTVRALETRAGFDGTVSPGEGWTDLVITPERGLRAVNALLTGLHEPRSTHLSMLAALAGFDHLDLAYREALRQRYLWHEFGDLHLLLP
jgi:S-adenosylmethionine:tRNA ribosyltransferase-isomerase